MVNQDLRDWSRQGGRKNRGSGSAVCWVGIAGALFCEGSCARQVVANGEDELEDSNGRYAARTMRCTCGSLGIFSQTRLETLILALSTFVSSHQTVLARRDAWRLTFQDDA